MRVKFSKIGWIFLLAVFIRVVYVLTLPHNIFWDDAVDYNLIVDNLLSGKGYFDGDYYSFRAPLYPLFLAGIYAIFGKNFLAVRIIQAIIISLSCIFIFLTAKNIFNVRIAKISAFIFALYPNFIYYPGVLLTESLFIFLLSVLMYFLVRLKESPNILNQIGSGLTLGVSALLKPGIFLFLPFSFFIFVIFEKNILKFMRIFIVVLASAFIVMSPWIVRNYLVHERFILFTTQGGDALLQAVFPGSKGGPASDYNYYQEEDLKIISNLSEVERDKYLYRKALKIVKDNPARIIRLAGIKFLRFWNVLPNYKRLRTLKICILSILSYLPVLILGIMGMVICIRRKLLSKAIFLYLIVLYYTLLYLIFPGSLRYRDPVMPYIIIFSAFALEKLLFKIKNKDESIVGTAN